MGYLGHGEAMIVIIDPFALPSVQDHLLPSEREDLAAAGMALSREDPADTFSRVLNELASRPDGGGQRRLAIVITKADLLRDTAVGRDAEDDPAGWLTRVGMGNLVREVGRRAGEVRYFASGLPADPDRLARLLGWLAGLRLNGHRRRAESELTAGDLRAPGPPGRTGRPDPGRLPRRPLGDLHVHRAAVGGGDRGAGRRRGADAHR
nr:hypothetical protein GCM10020093_111480 [Planobispora longispora]